MPTLLMPLFPTDRGYSGIFTWIEQVSTRLPETAPPGWTVHYLLEKGTRRLFPRLPRAASITEVQAGGEDRLRSLSWHVTQLPRWTRRLHADALLLPAGNRRICPFCHVPTVTVVHDLIGWEGSATRFAALSAARRAAVRRCLSGARSVVAVSAHTAEQVRRLGVEGHRIRVVRDGVDLERFSEVSPEQVASVLGALRLDPKFLLYVSRIEHPAKNHRNLIDGYALLRQRCPDTPPLVLVGKDWDGAEVVRRRAESPDVRDHVVFTGYVPSEQLPAIYRAAKALVFPSLAEGFGLPLLEAMAAGCPVLCSDRPPMNEIVGEAGHCFEPEYPEDIAEGLQRVVCDEEWRRGLVARGHQRVLRFTWTVTAQALWRQVLRPAD